MKRYFNIYHYLMIIPALILYTNCDGYKSTDSTASSLSNCTNSASLSLKLLKFNPEMDCNNAELIHCDRRNFSPYLESGSEHVEACVEGSAFGSLCLDLIDRNYNTADAEGSNADFAPGGAYNYSEVNCYLGHFSHNNKPIFQSSANSLQASLDALHSQCVERGQE